MFVAERKRGLLLFICTASPPKMDLPFLLYGPPGELGEPSDSEDPTGEWRLETHQETTEKNYRVTRTYAFVNTERTMLGTLIERTEHRLLQSSVVDKA